MKTYAIFSQKYDSEIWVTLRVGTRESLHTAKELIELDIEADPSLDRGYVESYPFFQAEWEMVGGRFEKGFDFNQVMEVQV